jgi:transitional endoplasmic reticulum ATPase
MTTDWGKADPDIEYVGRAITLPADPNKMPLAAAIKTLQRKQADEETETTVVEFIDTYPMDGAVAFSMAMKQLYGWASPVPEMTFFGSKPPQMRSVRIGPEVGDVIQVPWGQFALPNVAGPVVTASTMHEGKMQFVLHGNIKKRDAHVVRDLAHLTRQILATHSIYKGNAIRLRTNDNGVLDQNLDPEFLPVNYIQPGELVLNDGEAEQIETSLWTPIRHTEACVKYGIPLKRGILLEGPFGCGKSMTANVTSRVATTHGWTFILLDDVRALKDALLFAKRYAPAVVFAEDADRVAETRDERGNDLLNVIDGVVSKNSQVITVLTTNYVERLHPAMLRPGRLDAVISVRAPDAKSVSRLIHIYARGLLEAGTDLTEVGEVLAGNIPATIREVTERSKLAMIGRGASSINARDLLIAAAGMKDHLALLAPKPKAQSLHEKLGEAVHDVIKDAVGPMANGGYVEIRKKVVEIHEAVTQ